MSEPSVTRDTFDRLANDYDDFKLRVIPGYRDVCDLALRYASAGPCRRLLELGCGSGEWANGFMRVHPGTEYVAVEFSATMRDLASSRLAAYGPRIRLLDEDLNGSLPTGTFDRVVSFFAIHHVEDKQRLFHEVFASLIRGGVFLYADITVGATCELEQLFLDGWIDFMQQGIDAERMAHVLADHHHNDIAECSAVQLSYLQTAGFTPTEIIWSCEKFALFYAVKPILA